MPRRWMFLSNSPGRYRMREYTWVLTENLWFIVEEDYYAIMTAAWRDRANSDFLSPTASGMATLRAWEAQGVEHPSTPEECWRVNRRFVAIDMIQELMALDYRDKSGSRNSRLVSLYAKYIEVIRWFYRLGDGQEPSQFLDDVRLIDEELPHGMLEMYTELKKMENESDPSGFLINKAFKLGRTYSWLYSNHFEKFMASTAIKNYVESGKPDIHPEYITDVDEELLQLGNGDVAHAFDVYEEEEPNADSLRMVDTINRAELTHQEMADLSSAALNRAKVGHKEALLAGVTEAARGNRSAAAEWTAFVTATCAPPGSREARQAITQMLEAAKDNDTARAELQKRLALVQQLFARNLMAPDFLTGASAEDREQFIDEYLEMNQEAIGYYHDVVAAADAIITNRGDANTGMGLLTNSNWASLTGVFGALFSIGVLSRSWSGMSTSERVAGVRDTTLATVGAGAQMTQFVLGNFYGGTALTTEQMSSGTVTVNNVSRGTTGIDVAATSMQLTGAGVAILAGAVEFGQGVRNAYDLSYIHQRWAKAKKDWPKFKEALETEPTMNHFRKVCYKIRRRKYRASSSATMGAAKVGGGIIAILGTTGAVGLAVSNPVGWCVTGVTLLGAGGLAVHSYIRGCRHRRQLEHLRQPGRLFEDAPAFCKSTGDYHRWKVATFIFAAVCGPPEHWRGAPEAQMLGWQMAWVLVGGEDLAAVQWEITQMGVQGLLAFMRG